MLYRYDGDQTGEQRGTETPDTPSQGLLSTPPAGPLGLSVTSCSQGTPDQGCPDPSKRGYERQGGSAPALQLVEVVGHLAERAQHRRVTEVSHVRIAAPLEREGADMIGLARHGFGATYRGNLVGISCA